jgi:hypothetical protein
MVTEFVLFYLVSIFSFPITQLLFPWFKTSSEANLLFLESPVGVGFSYTNTTSDLDNIDDRFVGINLGIMIFTNRKLNLIELLGFLIEISK